MTHPLEAIETGLRKQVGAVFENVEVEPSAVSNSPFNYVYGYLSEKGIEGPQVCVSEAEEYGEEGFFVGAYKSYEAEEISGGVAQEATAEEAVAEAVRQAKELSEEEWG